MSSISRLNKPPTYHVKAGFHGRIVITLRFQGINRASASPNPFTCQVLILFPGVATSSEVVSSDSVTLSKRSQFIRYCNNLLFNQKINPFFSVQMCEEHYQKSKDDVENKHALQARPGLMKSYRLNFTDH